MSNTSSGKGVRGFVVGVLVSGAIAAGFMLSRQPAPPPPSSSPPTMPSPAAPAMPVGSPSPSPPATPREQADVLFNQVMMASEQNDQATLEQVLPPALAAYQALGPLDDDATYHVALLELSGARLDAARATAATLLAKNPQHLLALGVSMRAAASAGDSSAARDFAQRLLAAYDAESGRALPEYRDHGRVLPSYREEAQAAASR